MTFFEVNCTTMEKTLREILCRAIQSLAGPCDVQPEIEIPRDETHGDLSTPVAMGLAKILKRPPRVIAGDIASLMGREGPFEKVDIAGPGFINFFFAQSFLCDRLRDLINRGDAYMTEDIGSGRRIQIEFVSANPTGPLHLGHGRGAAVGVALANLLEAVGFSVEREYYINDAGRQVRLLGESVFARYNALHGHSYPFPEDGYKGDYIEDLATEFKTAYGDRYVGSAFGDVSDQIIDYAYKRILTSIEKDLADFGVVFDSWQSERNLFSQGAVVQAIESLDTRGHIYRQDGALWFRSTSFGDDKDRVVVKNDGEYTYFASDIAYHHLKVERGFDEIIDIWGADHHGYIPRMQAVIEALGHPRDRLRVLLSQMVSLIKGGKPVQMSKRAGEFITLREVMDDIGPDTTKFLFLTRRPDSHLEIDIEVAKAHSQENPVYYVQYAHARISSVLEKARAETPGLLEGIAQFDGSLYEEEDLRLLKKILFYPFVLRNAALAREPHRITFYLQELAGLFHPYYHKYRIISDDPALSTARLALCEGLRAVVRHGLKILSVNAPEKM